ncbi:DUF6891 domain-containing protein [Longimicrobium terrae]|nr:hypothetical protein [Longimicrobium terrae]
MMSLLRSWFSGERPPPPEPAVEASAGEGLDDLREWLVREIAAGFSDPDEIVEAAGDVFEGQLDRDVVQAEAERMLPGLLAAHAREEATWPETTDNDRLEAAFAELEDGGIVCRENFACCNNCGSAEIWAEVEAVNDIIPHVRGYVFYHMQDTESAVEGGGIYLSYGAVADTEDAPLAVARDVVSTLRDHGLRVEWNGEITRRIMVELDWKRRRRAAV